MKLFGFFKKKKKGEPETITCYVDDTWTCYFSSEETLKKAKDIIDELMEYKICSLTIDHEISDYYYNGDPKIRFHGRKWNIFFESHGAKIKNYIFDLGDDFFITHYASTKNELIKDDERWMEMLFMRVEDFTGTDRTHLWNL